MSCAKYQKIIGENSKKMTFLAALDNLFFEPYVFPEILQQKNGLQCDMKSEEKTLKFNTFTKISDDFITACHLLKRQA